MPQTATAVANKPSWVELSTPDAQASHAFYSKVFGWDIEVSPDPQYGGYAIAKLKGQDVAGIGPKQSVEEPTAWSLYIATDSVDETARNVQAAGGNVVAPPFDVGDQGRMAVFQDPSGAFFSAWEARQMRPFQTGDVNTFGWAELNARGIDKASRFYDEVFGWKGKAEEYAPDQPPYTTYSLDGQPILGGLEMLPQVPAEVPSYWTIYFNVDDVDKAYQRVLDAGGTEVISPQPMPGGRFALVNDPHGAMFGLLKLDPTEGQAS